MKKIFPWIIALSAFAVSASAGLYSIQGLGKMFAGASSQVMILAASLEFAKLVTASLLYQYWSDINRFLRIYLLAATLILILITSAGIYGFLSSAYQDTAFKVENQDKNVALLDGNIETIKRNVTNYEIQVEQKNKRIDKLTNIRLNLQNTQDTLIRKSLSTKGVRQQISDIDLDIKRLDMEVSALSDSISSKNNSISIIESKKMGISSDSDLAEEVGPLKYLSKLTGKPLDVVVNWYIIVLMLVFDPLAISLVIAANFAFSKSKNTSDGFKITEKILNNEVEKQYEVEDKKEDDIIVQNKQETFKINGFNEVLDQKDIKIADILIEHPEITEEIKVESNNTPVDNIQNKNEYIDKGFEGYRSSKVPTTDINPLKLQ